MLAIVVSRADTASEHVGEHLLDLAEWTERRDASRGDAAGGGSYYRTGTAEIRTFEDLHLHLAGAAGAFDDPDLLAFASRHSGDTGPLLTAHSTGNFGRAEYGGRDRELARSAPRALARVLDAFETHAPDGYDTGLECTHHGPSRVGCPSLFVELGSSESEWTDPAAARAVARSILALRDVEPARDGDQAQARVRHQDRDRDQDQDRDQARDRDQDRVRHQARDRDRTLVGFGGGHYAPRFTRIVRETDWAVGHIAADWALEDLLPERDRAVIGQAFERSGATRAVVDGDYPALEAVVEDLGYRVVSETWVRETTDVPLPFVARVEAALGPVDEGLRFGAPARGLDVEGLDVEGLDVEGLDVDEPVAFHTASMAGELLEEATGIDRERALAAVASNALAYSTAEGGSTPAGEVALAEAGAAEAVLDGLVDVLAGHYDRVERRDDEIVARTEAFDPERARALGVEEGPAFGRLAAGDPVEVEGRTVEPEAVRTTRTKRFDTPFSYRS